MISSLSSSWSSSSFPPNLTNTCSLKTRSAAARGGWGANTAWEEILFGILYLSYYCVFWDLKSSLRRHHPCHLNQHFISTSLYKLSLSITCVIVGQHDVLQLDVAVDDTPGDLLLQLEAPLTSGWGQLVVANWTGKSFFSLHNQEIIQSLATTLPENLPSRTIRQKNLHWMISFF